MSTLPRAPVRRASAGTWLRAHPRTSAGLSGLGLGAALAALGLGSPAALQELLRWESPVVALALLGAAAVLGIGLTHGPGRDRPHRWLLPGAVFLGAGAVLSGVLPLLPIVQLCQGELGALLALAGVVVGARVGSALFASREH